MKTAKRWLRSFIVFLACLGWLLPARPSLATTPETAPPSATKPMIYDLKLDAKGGFEGQLLNGAAQALPAQILSLRTNGQLVARSKTDADGRFAFGGLRGGVYQIGIADAVVTCRVWTANAAPPAAKPQLLIVAASEDVVRGQQPIGAIFTNPLVIGVVVAAAIAVPIAVHNDSSERPPGS